MHAERKIRRYDEKLDSWQSNKAYKNKLTTILRRAIIYNYNKNMKKEKGNMKVTWDTLNKVIHPN